jgi:hypothetical protein
MTFHDKAHEPSSEIAEPPDFLHVASTTVRDNAPPSSENREPPDYLQVDSAIVYDNGPPSSENKEPPNSSQVYLATVRIIHPLGSSESKEDSDSILQMYRSTSGFLELLHKVHTI